jgi:DNA-binding NarL/FixJ family response regulator
MNATKRIRIVCVDDSAETRAVFALLMQGDAEFDAVEPLSHTGKVEQCIAATCPDVVVLDLWMPGQDSLEVMRDAKTKFPHVRFLILSSDDDPKQIERAFANGASGFAVKDGNFERLATAIRKVAAGETVRPQGGARNKMYWSD